MGRFQIQILKNNAWETIFTINAENEEFSTETINWLDVIKFRYWYYSIPNYGIKFYYDT